MKSLVCWNGPLPKPESDLPKKNYITTHSVEDWSKMRLDLSARLELPRCLLSGYETLMHQYLFSFSFFLTKLSGGFFYERSHGMIRFGNDERCTTSKIQILPIIIWHTKKPIDWQQQQQLSRLISRFDKFSRVAHIRRTYQMRYLSHILPCRRRFVTSGIVSIRRRRETGDGRPNRRWALLLTIYIRYILYV